ncbi:hypothetical protein [Pedobacter sp. UYEF25]
MKKILFTILAAGGLFLFSNNTAFAQNYKTGAGLGIDFGDGSTLVGPTIRHHFSKNGAVQGEVLFGSNATFIQAFLQYNAAIPGAKGLDFFAGGGPSVGIGNGSSAFYLIPMGGLDYKFDGAPIALSLDWRPRIYIGDNNSSTNVGRFGLGFRYTFK